MKRNPREYTAKELMEVALMEIERLAGLQKKREQDKPKKEADLVCNKQQPRP